MSSELGYASSAYHMLGMQKVQATRDVQRNAAAAPPPAERVCSAAAVRAALQRAKQVAALNENLLLSVSQYNRLHELQGASPSPGGAYVTAILAMMDEATPHAHSHKIS